MTYRFFIISITLFAITLSFFVLPSVIGAIRHDPEVERLAEKPEQVFNTFSQCKKRVNDEELCYQAYSAAVKLANNADCTPNGISLRFKFKQLTEHTTEKTIARELLKSCPEQASDINKSYLLK